MAELVKCLTLDFGLAHDLKVPEFKPHIGLRACSAEPAYDFLILSLSGPPLLTLSQNKLKKKKKKVKNQEYKC